VNFVVALQLVGNSLAPTCKCHGVSGSCSIKTCWKALPDVRQFGLALQKRYATALEIRARRDRRSRERRLVAVQRSRRSVADDELVYYTISPDYCLPDSSLGSVGTRGRYDIRQTYKRVKATADIKAFRRYQVVRMQCKTRDPRCYSAKYKRLRRKRVFGLAMTLTFDL